MSKFASNSKKEIMPGRLAGEHCFQNFAGLSSKELALRLAQKEEAAWQYLWEQYAGITVAIIRRLIVTRNWFALKGWEEDLLGESFGRLLKGFAKFRGTTPEEMNGFLRTNVVFTCLQKLRDLRSCQSSCGESEESAIPAEDYRELVECEQILHEAIAALPKELAEVVRFNLEGYSSEEAADSLRIPRQTIFERKHRALSILRDRLKSEEFWEHCAPHISEIRLTRERRENK